MRIIYHISLLLVCIGMAGCKKDKHPQKPRYITDLKVTAIDKNGATFFAQLADVPWDKIDQVGYIWSLEQKPENAAVAYRVDTERPNLDGNFTLKAETGIEEGLTYYVTAFVVIGGEYYYGDEASFVGQGSRGLVIQSLVPNTGTWGDTVTVHIRNIPSFSSQISVTMEGAPAKVIYADKEAIRFVVPDAVSSGRPVIEFALDGSVSRQLWSMAPPQLDSVSNYTPRVGEQVTLYGKNFNPQSLLNKITHGGRALTVVQAGHNQIEFLAGDVPMSLKAPIEVTTVGDAVVSEFNLSILKYLRKLSDFPGAARYYAVSASLNGVGYFGLGALGRIDVEQLPPPGDFWSYDASSDHWQLISNKFATTDIALSSSFVYQNKLYTGGGVSYAADIFPKSWYSFNPSEQQWSKGYEWSVLPTDRVICGFSVGGEVIAIGITEQRVVQYYRLASGVWEYVGDLDKAHHDGVSFVIDGKCYLTTGWDWDLGYNNDLDVYDSKDKTWTKAAPFPGNIRRMSTAFSLHGKGYIYGGGNDDQRTSDIWEYTPQTDTWRHVENLVSSAYSGFSSFVIAQKAYIIGGSTDNLLWSIRASKEVWEFDMDGN